jgi:hypothetical protein
MTKDEYDSKVLSLKFTHDYNMLCFIRGQYIESLEAEVEKLKATAIQWHKYPDEKPKPNTRHLVVVNGYVLISRYDAEQDIDKINVTHWAYLPAPPREESND